MVKYSPGERPLYDHNCNQISGGAGDHVVEAADNDWDQGERHTVSFQVTPRKSGTLWLRVRTTMKGPGTCAYYHGHSVKGGVDDTDQQGRAVERFAVTVREIPSIDVPVLMYHKIEPRDPVSGYWVTDRAFAQHLDALRAYGYTTVSFDDFMAYRNGTRQPPSEPVIITIDDGYQDLYTEAFPELQARSMTATAFLPTGKIADAGSRQDSSWDPDPTEGANPAPHLIWDEVRTMWSAGLHFESHSVSHPHLVALRSTNPPQAQAEITDSKTTIESKLPGHTVKFFAYPFGIYDSTIQQWIRDAGYKAAISVNQGIENTRTADLWAIKRIEVHSAVSVDFDENNPQNFFMTLIDPDFDIPDARIHYAKTLDSEGKERSIFYPGEKVTVVVTASNNGSPVNVIASLRIDDDQDSGSPSLYDSHQQYPSEDVEKRPFTSGPAQDFTYTWTIPESASPGQYHYNLGVHDEHYVLGFRYSGWQTLFSVAG